MTVRVSCATRSRRQSSSRPTGPQRPSAPATNSTPEFSLRLQAQPPRVTTRLPVQSQYRRHRECVFSHLSANTASAVSECSKECSKEAIANPVRFSQQTRESPSRLLREKPAFQSTSHT